MSSGQHNPAFYLSHLAPLAWRCVEQNTTQELAVLRAMQVMMCMLLYVHAYVWCVEYVCLCWCA